MAYAPAGINRRCNDCGLRHGAPNPCGRGREPNACHCPGNGTHAHVRGCHLHPEYGRDAATDPSEGESRGESGMTRIASDGGGGTWVRRAPADPTPDSPPDRAAPEGLVEALAPYDNGCYSCDCPGNCPTLPCHNGREDLLTTVEAYAQEVAAEAVAGRLAGVEALHRYRVPARMVGVIVQPEVERAESPQREVVRWDHLRAALAGGDEGRDGAT